MAGDNGREVWFERRKWPATPHYGHAARHLGEDEFGSWYDVRKGDPLFRGAERLHDWGFSATVLVCAREGFIAWFWRDGEGVLDLYVDIVTNVELSTSEMLAVDLDLDIIRFRDDGRVKLVDEDEFALHQVELGYPEQVIAHATVVAARTLDAVRAGVAPFDGVAAARWTALTLG